MKNTKNTDQEIIVIIGYGWVGQANALALVQMGYRVFYYDIVPPIYRYGHEQRQFYETIKPLGSPQEKDSIETYYLICVGDHVRNDGEQDITLIQEAIRGLDGIQGKVVLRSTVLPQHLLGLRFDYYVPEFLHEKHAVEECLNPFYFVIGKRDNKSRNPSFLSEWQLRAKKVFYGTPEEASYVKYLSNTWNAVRIVFINEFGDAIRDPEDQESLRNIERIIDFVFERRHYMRYGRAFGGHCLPKDLRAFANAHAKTQSVPLLQAALASNDAHYNKELRYQHLPQWFSGWNDEYAAQSNMTLSSLIWYKFNLLTWVATTRRHMRFIVDGISALIPDRSLSQVREIWDRKAKENARYFVNTRGVPGKDVTEFDVRESGKYDYDRYVAWDPFLASALKGQACNRVLEVGCGIGRMTEFFVQHFTQVYGVDISPLMIEIAKKHTGSVSDIQLASCDGRTLQFPSNHFDCVFSYQTFQHIPTASLLMENLKECHRVLKPGGVAKLHMRTGRGPYKWHWAYGASVTPELAKSIAESAGFRFLNHQIEGSKGLWVCLEKP